MTAVPLEPTRTLHLFPVLSEKLTELLRALEPQDWNRPTVCSEWAVRDIAAHLLDSACRRVSYDRDDYQPPPPDRDIAGWDDLVGYLNELNADWVKASRRLSPRILVELLEWVEPRLVEGLSGLDPLAPARFPVSWAGQEESTNWFDTARELTERWLHQQQIRLAVGAPQLTDPELSAPIFDTFLRALPHRYAMAGVAEPSRIAVDVVGEKIYRYVVSGSGSSWSLCRGPAASVDASIRIPEEAAWLLLTKGRSGEAARQRSANEGDEKLLAPFFDVVAVMA